MKKSKELGMRKKDNQINRKKLKKKKFNQPF